MLENYQIFQSKKSNSYEKILFVARANTDKFPENDEYVKNEKAQYLKNLIQKHQAHLPWELQRNKFIFIKTKPKIPNKPLNPLKEDQETDGLQNTKKKVDKKDKKKEEKIDNLEILSDKPLEEKHEIVETSMEEDSVN